MYRYYIRNMYLENNLRDPGKLTMCGVPVDLGKVDMPAYLLATREDHIVPWRTAYSSTCLLGGRIEFVLSASGHIAGVINPASKNRRNFWLNPQREENSEHWLAAAAPQPGSWWPHWAGWLAPFGGAQVPAPRQPGGGVHRQIEPAPGSYVKEKCS
ncbi:Poly-beta-hydroxybutyrate polymerase [compost metagenome]